MADGGSDERVQEADSRLKRLLFETEFPRRVVHASGSVLPALYLVDLATWPQVVVLFVIAAVVATILEALRLSVGLDWFIYEYLTREYEEDGIAGYWLYTLSSAGVAVASLAVVEPLVAIAAILMLTLGDPIGGTVGSSELRRVKRPPALAAMFLVCAIIAAPLVWEWPIAIVLGAGAAMVADGVTVEVRGRIVDDNLTIPPAAAVAMQIGVELTAFV